jgi:hypothetical protein
LELHLHSSIRFYGVVRTDAALPLLVSMTGHRNFFFSETLRHDTIAGAGFEVFPAMMTRVVILWVVTPYSDLVGYQRFEVPCQFHFHPEDGGSIVLQNACIFPRRYTMSLPRIPRLQTAADFIWSRIIKK